MANPRPAWRNPNRSPIDIPGDTHPLPPDAFRWLPKFNNDGHTTPEIHLSMLTQALDALVVEHEDVAVRLFAMSFHGPVQEWFYALPAGSITSWDDLEERFLTMYSRCHDPSTAVRELTHISKDDYETMQDFSCRFLRLYTQLPLALRPPESLAIQLYQNALHPRVSFVLKREDHTNLSQCMDSACEIERQMISARLIEAPLGTTQSSPLAIANSHSSSPVTHMNDPLSQKLQSDNSSELEILRRMAQELSDELTRLKQSCNESYSYPDGQHVDYDYDDNFHSNHDDVSHQVYPISSSDSCQQNQIHSDTYDVRRGNINRVIQFENISIFDDPKSVAHDSHLESHQELSEGASGDDNTISVPSFDTYDQDEGDMFPEPQSYIPEASQESIISKSMDQEMVHTSCHPHSEDSPLPPSSLDPYQSDEYIYAIDDPPDLLPVMETSFEFVDQPRCACQAPDISLVSDHDTIDEETYGNMVKGSSEMRSNNDYHLYPPSFDIPDDISFGFQPNICKASETFGNQEIINSSHCLHLEDSFAPSPSFASYDSDECTRQIDHPHDSLLIMETSLQFIDRSGYFHQTSVDSSALDHDIDRITIDSHISSMEIPDQPPDLLPPDLVHCEFDQFSRDGINHTLCDSQATCDDIIEGSNPQLMSSQADRIQFDPPQGQIVKRNINFDTGLAPDVQLRCYIHIAADKVFYAVVFLGEEDEPYLLAPYKDCMQHIDDELGLIDTFYSSKETGWFPSGEDGICSFISIHCRSSTCSWIDDPVDDPHDYTYPVFVDRRYLIHFYPP